MELSNKEFTLDPAFIKACEMAKEAYGLDIKPTAAQASKYRRGFGAAFNAERAKEDRGSKTGLKSGPTASFDAQRSDGRMVPQEYGPYAPKGLCNVWPKKKKGQ
jgi:hypothetical protein